MTVRDVLVLLQGKNREQRRDWYKKNRKRLLESKIDWSLIANRKINNIA